MLVVLSVILLVQVERWHDLWDPDKPLRAKFIFLLTLPMVLVFCIIPDCRPPGKEYLATATFIGKCKQCARMRVVTVRPLLGVIRLHYDGRRAVIFHG